MIRGSIIRLELPTPPSANHLFPTNKQGRRFRSREYEKWLTNAEASLWMTKFRPIPGPVQITITIEDAGRIDLANHEKALVDFVVKHKLIEDDKRSIVRRLIMQWGKISGALVEIEGIAA